MTEQLLVKNGTDVVAKYKSNDVSEEEQRFSDAGYTTERVTQSKLESAELEHRNLTESEKDELRNLGAVIFDDDEWKPNGASELYERFKDHLESTHGYDSVGAMDLIDNLLQQYGSIRLAVDARRYGDAKQRVDKDQASNSPILGAEEASDLKDIIDGVIQ